MNNVIDMWAPLVPAREIIAHVERHFPKAMLGYMRVFYKRKPTLESAREVMAALASDDDAILAMLDAAHIELALITGFDEAESSGCTFVSNESVAAVHRRHPKRFLPFAGADIFRGHHAIVDVEHWIKNEGFRGLSLRPFMIGLPASDRRYYPFYEKCVELDVPLSIHASANWTASRPSDLGHPRHFDQVACDFPELKLILSHAGYPWVLEACLLAWKHENVYLELAAHRPKYFTAAGSGWEPLLRFGQTTIADKVLYGSGAFLLGAPPALLIEEMRALPLRPGILDKWLYHNAATLLGLDTNRSVG